MRRKFHITMLVGILVVCLYAAIKHSGYVHEKCNQEWRMNFIDNPSPLTKAGIILIY